MDLSKRVPSPGVLGRSAAIFSALLLAVTVLVSAPASAGGPKQPECPEAEDASTNACINQDGDNETDTEVEAELSGGDGVAGGQVIGGAGISGEVTISADNDSEFANADGGDADSKVDFEADSGPDLTVEGDNINVESNATGTAIVSQTAAPNVEISLSQFSNPSGEVLITNTASSLTTATGSSSVTAGLFAGPIEIGDINVNQNQTGTVNITNTVAPVQNLNGGSNNNNQTNNQTGTSTISNTVSPVQNLNAGSNNNNQTNNQTGTSNNSTTAAPVFNQTGTTTISQTVNQSCTGGDASADNTTGNDNINGGGDIEDNFQIPIGGDACVNENEEDGGFLQAAGNLAVNNADPTIQNNADSTISQTVAPVIDLDGTNNNNQSITQTATQTTNNTVSPVIDLDGTINNNQSITQTATQTTNNTVSPVINFGDQTANIFGPIDLGGAGTNTITQTSNQTVSPTTNNTVAPVLTITGTNTANITGSAPVTQSASASTNPTAVAVFSPIEKTATILQNGDNDVEFDPELSLIGGDAVAGGQVIGLAGVSGSVNIDANNRSRFATADGGDADSEISAEVDSGPDLTLEGSDINVEANATGVAIVSQTATPSVTLSVDQVSSPTGSVTISSTSTSETNATQNQSAAAGIGFATQTVNQSSSQTVSPTTNNTVAPVLTIDAPNNATVTGSAPVLQTASASTNPTAVSVFDESIGAVSTNETVVVGDQIVGD